MEMPLWPFRRRSSRKRTRSGTALSDLEQKSNTEPSPTIQRGVSKKKQRTEPMEIPDRQTQTRQTRRRTYSFSPGRNDYIRNDRSRERPVKEKPVRGARDMEKDATGTTWDRTPTLHRQKPNRRKSSKRRREDSERAAEIKAMTNFMPVRPATDQWQAGRPMKKDTRRIRTGFGSQHASEVSLPTPASIHSTLSSDTEFGSYKVSTLDSLAPRPTLRVASGSRWTPSRASAPARSASDKRPLAERAPIPEEVLHSHSRIDELADDLDAGDLRELMERDRRRRERKQKRDQERVARRRAQKEEAHRAKEAEARQMGTPPPENLERGSAGRDMIGLGIDPASVVVTSSRQRDSGASESMRDAAEEMDQGENLNDPLNTFHRTDTMPLDEPEEDDTAMVSSSVFTKITQEPTPEPEEQVSSLPRTSRLSSLLRSKKSRSRSTLNSDKEKPISPPPGIIDEEIEAPPRKDSEASTKAGRFSFTSFLRRGGRNSRRESTDPASFSNTSREEMQAAASSSQATMQTAAHAQAVALAKLQGEDPPQPPVSESNPVYLVRKPSVDVPKRTRSRFREDLPDFTGNNSNNAIQEAEPPLPPLPGSLMGGMQPIPIARYDSPMSGHRSLEALRQSPTSFERVNGPSPDPHHSISLASIDSEGSWLSGGAISRRTSALRDNATRTHRRPRHRSSNFSANSTEDDLTIADDEYLSKLAPTSSAGILAMQRTREEGRPSSDEEDIMRPVKVNAEESMMGGDDDVNWGSVGARHDVVHSHTRERVQSRHGLLNDIEDQYEDEAVDSTGSDEQSGDSLGAAQLQRAESVELKRGNSHARTFSAGSAKLLEIASRTSMDAKSLVQKDGNNLDE